MLIAVINESTLVSNSDVEIMTQAIQIQLDLHVLPAWNMKAGTIKFYADPKKVPGYAWVVSMLDNSTQAGALDTIFLIMIRLMLSFLLSLY